MIFNLDYYGPMDKKFSAHPEKGWDIEQPISVGKITVNEMGRSVTEGQGAGTFLDSIKAAIFEGASSIELAAKPEGSQPMVGMENYGRAVRQDIRELARANQITFTSVHTPPEQVGNLSGFDGREGFSPQFRERQLNEVKKAIDFAADTGAKAVVVHTGEFQRPMIGQEEKGWKDEKGRELFTEYIEEPGKGVIYLVDDRNGHIISQVRRNEVVHRPVYKKADKDYDYTDPETREVKKVKKDGFIDYEGKPVDRANRVPEYDEKEVRFKTEPWRWADFEKEAKLLSNELGEKVKPEEAFIKAQLESQIAQAKGWAKFHIRSFEDAKKQVEKLTAVLPYYRELEEKTPPEERWKLMQEAERTTGFTAAERKLPSEIIKEAIRHARVQIESIKESSLSSEQQAKAAEENLKHIRPIGEYALAQSVKSYAEAGIYAMKKTQEANAKEPVFVAPENIWPEMGYGSHPQELIKIVTEARKKMIDYLTQKEIEDPYNRVNEKGEVIKIANPYRISGLSVEEAKQKAEEHIKATLDTQHLGMWWRYFQPKPGESEDQTRKRFNNWYMEQVKEMEKSGIIGHMHVVDGFGKGHAHLPAGEGAILDRVSPVISAVEYLKKKGYKGTMISEAFGTPGGRELQRTWAALGSPLYSAHVGPLTSESARRWGSGTDGVWQSYFGYARTPYFIFGGYSPSEDFKLWSEVLME